MGSRYPVCYVAKVNWLSSSKIVKLGEDKRSKIVLEDYLSYVAVVGIVEGENSVGVPLRRLFRYEWMNVTDHDMLGYFLTELV